MVDQYNKMLKWKVTIFYKSRLKVDAEIIFTKSDVFLNSSRSNPNACVTFVRKFAAKNFQKSTNLVTQVVVVQ